jgi:DNA-binding MarR family transcriptional regulator
VLRAHDLSVAQFDVLVQVAAHEGLTQRELATALLVTKGNVCQLLDRMELAQLLQRRPAGRTNRIYLTDRGRDLLKIALPEQEASVSRLMSALSTQEQRALLRLLGKLDRALTRIIEIPETTFPDDCLEEEQ